VLLLIRSAAGRGEESPGDINDDDDDDDEGEIIDDEEAADGNETIRLYAVKCLISADDDDVDDDPPDSSSKEKTRSFSFFTESSYEAIRFAMHQANDLLGSRTMFLFSSLPRLSHHAILRATADP